MVMKTLTLSCLLAAACLQAASAQVFIADDTNSTTTTNSTSNGNTTMLMSLPPLVNLASAHVLVENNLETGGALFPFIVLAESRTGLTTAAACAKLGELPYSAQSRALPAVQDMLAANYPTVTEFYVDNGGSNNSCSTLVMTNGVASINNGGSCLRLLPALCSNINTNGKITVQSALGPITGARDAFGFRFSGIRYAKAPTGSLRFAAPAPITASWSTAVNALTPGSMCMQAGGGSEDCLFLNVFTPKLSALKTTTLPVMVYIHGGSFTTGSGADPAFNPANLASRGQVVVVSINYRLGVFGFFERTDIGVSRSTLPGNQGVRDMITALQWVKANINAFGGDASKVTIFGESAGGHAVRALLSMSAATKGLFSAAISQSDPADIPFNTASAASEIISAGIMNMIGCTTDVTCAKNANATAIMNAQNTLVASAITMAPQQSFLELIKPTIDGVLIFDNINNLIGGAKGGVAQVPVLLGTMKDEAIGFLPSLGQSGPMPTAVFGITSAVILGYQRAMVVVGSGAYPIDTSAADGTRQTEGVFAADYLWICPTQNIAKALASASGAKAVYQYQFNRGYSPIRTDSDACYQKVCHGDDVALVFASPLFLNDPNSPWTADDAAESRFVMDAWTQFAKTNNPNVAGSSAPTWPAYDASSQNIFIFDVTPSVVAGGLRAQNCYVLDNYVKYDYQL